MRVAFFVLIFANVLFMAWANWIDVPPQPRTPGITPTLPRLQLADEPRANEPAENRADAGQPTASTDAVAAIPTAAASRCVSVGPFNDLTRAARAAALLRERGFQPQQRAEEGEMWEGFWVFVSGVRNDAEEKRMLTALQRAGINDAHPMPESSIEGRRVSLGLFSERNRAERRAREATRLGFKPEITERSQPGTVYWVDLDLGASNNSVPTTGLLSLEEAGSRIGIRVCPGSAPPVVDPDETTTANAGTALPG